MNSKISKFFVLSVVLIIVLNNLTSIDVFANSTDTEVEIIIDESVGDVSALFDTIGRFSRSGIAKIGKITKTESYEDEYGQQVLYDVYQYGLMNINGEVLLEPIYDEISDYNDQYYSIRKYFYENDSINIKEGLVSKTTGQIVIEPLYDWIPDLDSNFITLYRSELITEENNTFYKTYSEIKSNKDGVLKDIKVPNGVTLDKFEWVYVNHFLDDYNFIIGYYSTIINSISYYKQESWITDKYGNAISDHVFSYFNGYIELNGSIYFTTRLDLSEDGTEGESGLFKLTSSNSGYTIEEIIDPSEGYDYIWIDEYEGVARYSKYDGNYYNWGYYNLESGVFVDGSNYNNYVNEFSVKSLDGLKLQHNCGSDENGVWKCELKAFEEGTDINIIEGMHFNSYNDQYDGYLILYNYDQCEDTMSNVIYKDIDGQFKLLFNENITGYMTLYSNQYFVANTWGENARLSIKKMVNNQPITIVENKANAWFYTSNNILYIYSRDMSNQNEYIQKYTLFDLINNSMIVDDVSGLNYTNTTIDGNVITIGSYTNKNSEKLTFIYKGGEFKTLDVESKYISEVFEDGTISSYDYFNYDCNTYIYNQETQEYTYGLGSCTKQTQSLFDFNGNTIAEDYDYITRYSNQKVMIGYKSTYNETSRYFERTSEDYIYYDPLDVEEKYVRTFAGYQEIDLNLTGIALLTKNTVENRYTFVKNGKELEDVNRELIGATKISSFSDSSLVYSKLSEFDQNMNEIYIINEKGEKFIIPNAIEFEGKIIKINSDIDYWVYADIVTNSNQQSELLLTALPDIIINQTQSQQATDWPLNGLDHIANQFYSYRVFDNYLKQGLFYSELEENVRIFSIVGQKDDLPNGTYFNQISSIENSDFYTVTDLNDKKGIIDSDGQFVIKPEEYTFSYFSLQNNLIYAYDWTQNSQGMTLFDLNGNNLLYTNNENSIYFSYVNTDQLNDGYFMAYKHIEVDGQRVSVPYLFSYKNNQVEYIGNFYVNKINENMFIYRDYFYSYSGLMNGNLEVIVSIDKGNINFSFDSKNRLISGWKNINNSYVPGGLYTFDGLELLDGYYEPEWIYDAFDSYNNTMNIDSRGFLRIRYQNPNYKEFSYYGICTDYDETICQCLDVEYAYHQSNPNLYNYFDLRNNRLVYPNPVSSDSVSEDGFINVSELVKVEGSIEDDIINNKNYKTIELDGIIYKAEYKSVVYNMNYDVVIPAGTYDYIYWDSDLTLVKVANMFTERREDGIYSSYKYGLLDKLGNVVVEPIYQSIEYDDELGMYVTLLSDWNEQGLIDSSGNIVAEAVYNGISYRDELNWLIMSRNSMVTSKSDSSHQIPISVVDIYDLNTKTIKFKDVTELDLYILSKQGVSPIGFSTGSGTSNISSWTDSEGVIHEHEYAEEYSKFGLVDLNGNMILEPKYDMIYRFDNGEGRTFEGIYEVSLLNEKHECYYKYFNHETNRFIRHSYSCNQYLRGIYSIKDGFVLQPKYNDFYQRNSDGYVITSMNEFKTENYLVYDDVLDTDIEEVHSYYQQVGIGFANIYTGEILEPIYSELTTTYSRREQRSIPPFDNNGYIKVVKYQYDDENSYYAVGLADKDGLVFDINYQLAYYLNGYFYGSINDYTWEIVNAQNKEERYSISVSRENSFVKSIELINDKVIVESVINDGFDQYSEYGVLFLDNSEFLPFDYTEIKSDGNFWYLEKYNPLYGTYTKAIMDNQKIFILPFNDKYDSLSDFVGGFAIGQKGEVTETSALDDIPLLGSIFLPIRAAENDFVLEIIDENGKVVADLSDQFESATLLGEVDGVLKVLVKKDGKYYFANLIKKESSFIPISNVNISLSSLILELGESYQLIGSIEPVNFTENIRSYWESLDESVASVNSDGLVKAVGVGKTTIRYVVNNLVEQCEIEVFESKITETKVGLENVPKTLSDNISLLGQFINKDIKLSNNEFIKLVSDLYRSDLNFLKYLDFDDLILVEDKFLEVFSNLIDLKTDKVDFQIRFEGLGLLVDLKSILDAVKNYISVKINTNVNEEDLQILNNYLSNYGIQQDQSFSLDIKIERKVNDQLEELSELLTPVKITLKLPSYMLGLGELEVINIHNGEISVLPVSLAKNGEASFTTTQFSTFTIVKAINRNKIENVEKNINVTASTDFFSKEIIGLGLSVLLLILILFFRKLYFKTN